MKNKHLKSRIDESDFQFHDVPPDTLELNQETIDSVQRWYDYQMKYGGNIQNAHILDLLCEDILAAWNGEQSAIPALEKDLDTAKRTFLGGLMRYLKGLIRIGELILEREPSLNESVEGEQEMDIETIYRALKSEYDGQTWSDEFIRIHVTLMRDGQVICWFDLDKDDEGFEEKRDCAISFYDEVVRFLVDNFGEKFKYEDPRISDGYIDKNNINGQYEIVLDDDGENAPVIAIWENEENEMKTRFNENKKIVKEGAGAGYDVKINGLKLGEILEKKLVKGKQAYDDYYVCQVEILPCECEIGAEDYYNDFFWQEHEFGETPTAKIDGGVATIEYSTNSYDEEEAEDELRREISHRELDISFSYSWGWTHSDLPRENMKFTDVDVNEKAFYGSITQLELIAPDLADAVNGGYASLFDREEEEEEEEEDEEQVNEVSGWDLEDEDLTLVNSESDGDKLYIVKLWWGSGYQMDCYNAYAFNEEEALNYVVAYIEKNDPETLEAADECAKNLLNEIEQDHISATEMGYDDDFYPEDTPEFQESFIWVDATMEGAKKAHYIWTENLAIAEYPKDHGYPMSKDIKR